MTTPVIAPQTREIGIVRALYRYPVKSMAGETCNSVEVGWHGVEGDRRYAFVRSENTSGFPWLTATRFPQLLHYTPLPHEDTALLRVRTPEGQEFALRDQALADEISKRFDTAVYPMRLDAGIFDQLPLSLITTQTIQAISEQVGQPLEVARFRPNILVEAYGTAPFPEDAWVGGLLTFGADGAQMRVNERDTRCATVNYAPDTLERDANILRTIAHTRAACLGVYGATERQGTIRVGDLVWWG